MSHNVPHGRAIDPAGAMDGSHGRGLRGGLLGPEEVVGEVLHLEEDAEREWYKEPFHIRK